MSTRDQCRRQVFKNLWQHYYGLVPYASKIEQALQARGDLWAEDHVAFRTLPGPNCGAHVLQKLFETLGYQRQDDYHFEEKRLKAFWMAPPDTDGKVEDASPKIFISELMPDRFSSSFQDVVRRYTSQVTASPLSVLERLDSAMQRGDDAVSQQVVQICSAYLTSSPAWSRPAVKDFECLQKESEYASLTLLYGSQINHFTVSVHLMKSFPSIAALGEYLEAELKIPMNRVGGLVKGTAELQLEQIATKAVSLPYLFQDAVRDETYGFVEFALRYPLKEAKADGRWHSYYQGFVTSNADKIFESTYKG